MSKMHDPEIKNTRPLVTWRQLILLEMEAQGDSWDKVIDLVSDGWLDTPFHNGYGLPEGHPFTLWTETRVYFPVKYDGAEWVGSVARDPDDKETEHVGG